MASNVSEVKQHMKDGLLSCAICSEVYRTPKVLPCLHSFCEGCLACWVKKNDGKLTCPNCRLRCLLPSGGVTALQTNYQLAELIEYVETLSDVRSRPCDGCHVNEAASLCQECRHVLCKHCATTHVNWAEYKGHRVVDLEGQKGQTSRTKDSKAASYLYCPNHMENPVIAYCTTCEIPICRTCTAGKHREHAHKSVSQVAEADQNLLKFLARELEQAQQKVVARREGLNKTFQDLESVRGDVESQIEQHTQRIIEDVFKKQGELKGELESVVKQRQLAIKSQLEILEDDSRSLTSALKLTEGVVQSAGLHCGLSTNKAVHRHVNYLLTKTCIFTDEIPTVSFVPNLEFVEQRLGEILLTTSESSAREEAGDGGAQPDSGPSEIYGSECARLDADLSTKGKKIESEEFESFQEAGEMYSVGGTVRVLGESGKGRGEFTFPNGLTVNQKDELVVADMDNHRVQIMNWHGKCRKVLTFDIFSRPFEPSNVAVSDDGIYYVTDIGNGQIVVCDEDSHLLRTFGQDERLKPDGVVLTRDGFVVVSDLQKTGHCLRKYTLDGRHVATYGKSGSGPGEFDCPSSLAVTSHNQILVSDGDNNRIQILNTDGHYVSSFGDNYLSGPGGIGVDRDDNVYVCDDAAKVVKFDKRGKFLETVVQEGDIVPFYVAVRRTKPACLAISEGCNNVVKVVTLQR